MTTWSYSSGHTRRMSFARTNSREEHFKSHFASKIYFTLRTRVPDDDGIVRSLSTAVVVRDPCPQCSRKDHFKSHFASKIYFLFRQSKETGTQKQATLTKRDAVGGEQWAGEERRRGKDAACALIVVSVDRNCVPSRDGARARRAQPRV